SNNVHLIYRETGGNAIGCFYQKYNGSSWSSATEIVQGTETYRASYSNSIAIDSNDVLHVAFMFFHNSENKGKKAGYMKSEDGGSTWKKSNGTTYSLPVTYATAESVVTGDNLRVGTIAVDSGNHPMFVINRLYNSPKDAQFWRYNGSSWAGTSLSVASKIINQYMSTSYYNNVIYVFASVATTYGWPPSDDGEIYIFYSTDNGSSFSQKQISTTDASNPNWIPNAEQDNGANTLSEMRLLWTNGGSNPTKIYFAKINASYDAELYSFGKVDTTPRPSNIINFRNYDQIWLMTPGFCDEESRNCRGYEKWHQDEINEIIEFVKGGGGLLLITDSGMRKSEYERVGLKVINKILTGVGYPFNQIQSCVCGCMEGKIQETVIEEHELTKNLPGFNVNAAAVLKCRYEYYSPELRYKLPEGVAGLINYRGVPVLILRNRIITLTDTTPMMDPVNTDPNFMKLLENIGNYFRGGILIIWEDSCIWNTTFTSQGSLYCSNQSSVKPEDNLIIKNLQSKGYDVDIAFHNKEINMTLLNEYNQVWLFRPGWCELSYDKFSRASQPYCSSSIRWSNNELECLKDYAGGSGRLVIFADYSPNLPKRVVNTLFDYLDFDFLLINGFEKGVYTTDIVDHELTKGINRYPVRAVGVVKLRT
ncbi:MAG: BNR-4 repeat-containing protein, partial [Candidatus Aenigmarchaeota archaeon]|nr:BNR-4 repeat-containing protein [Candidatus Aenigmarchaeota archaeon]